MDRLQNVTQAPMSTALGGAGGGLGLLNAVALNFDPHNPVMWVNLVIGVLTLVVGALSGPQKA